MAHPKKGRITGLNQEGKPFTLLEDFILNRSLVTLASQKRFGLFQKITQQMLKEGMILASVPCGVMRDLLTLDFSKIANFRLIGVDLDPESLQHAAVLAKQMNLVEKVAFLKENAWELNIREEWDLITSSGLNVYEPDKTKVLQLYRKFFEALKPGGILITAILTDPSEWNMNKIPPEDLYLEKVLYGDILDLKWRNYRKHAEIEQELQAAGFTKVDIFYDEYRVFPTVVARKK